jgi:tight adherence protein B
VAAVAVVGVAWLLWLAPTPAAAAARTRARSLGTVAAGGGWPGIGIGPVVGPALAASVATVVVSAAVGPWAGAAVVLVALALPARARRRRRSRRGGGDELPVVLERTARSLRAGGTLSDALADALDRAGPSIQPAITDVRAALVADNGFGDAVGSWPVALGRDHEIVRATLGLAADLGGGRARLLDATARLLRAELDARAEVAAAATQARVSAAVLAVAPVAFLVLSMGIDPSVVEALIDTAPGRACLGAGLLLDVVGFAVMMRIVDRAVPA